MFIQKTCRQVFAACFGLSLFLGLETKASALIPNFTDNYVVLDVVNVPSGQLEYQFSAFVSDSNFLADSETVSTFENGTFTSDDLSTRANYVYWGFNLDTTFGTQSLTLSQNAIAAGFYFPSTLSRYYAVTPYIANQYGATAYLTFDYNTFILDANIEQESSPNPTPVPERGGGISMLTFGILSASYLLKKQLKKQKSFLN